MGFKPLGWLNNTLGIDPMQQNFSYDPAQSNISGTNTMLDSAMNNVNQSASTLSNQAGSTFAQGQSFLNPNSDYYKQQRGFLTEDIAQGVNEQNRSSNQMLASRGIGGGGISSMLGAVNSNAIGENVRKGFKDLYNQGLGVGTNLLQAGMQGQQGAGNLYGQTGQMAAGIQGREVQQSMFNAGAQNDQEQYTRTSQYNQGLANRERKADFWNNAISSAATFFSPG